MGRVLSDQITFFRQFREQFETTGAIAPSSRGLARSMTRFLAAWDGLRPVRVLEIGPGTGSVTDEIVRLIRPGDTFDLVELNDSFVKLLQQRFRTDESWRAVAPWSRMHQQAIQQFDSPERYDFVISGLPLNNFSAELVESIADKYFTLLRPGGVLSYFEYMYVRPVRKRLARGRERQRISRIDKIMQGHCDRCRIGRDRIWLNVPPAWVQHLKAAPQEADGI